MGTTARNVEDTQTFLIRVKEFESRYNMAWPDFMVKYSTGSLHEAGRASVDYAEWAFLCENLYADLIAMEMGESPPAEDVISYCQKPEPSSGFLFWGREHGGAGTIFQPRGGHSKFGSELRNYEARWTSMATKSR
jgi:hypothetical protein